MNVANQKVQRHSNRETVSFPKLDDRLLALLEPVGRRQILRKGQLLSHAGEWSPSMIIVLRGEFEVFDYYGGHETVVASLRARDFVSDVALLDGTAAILRARGKANESEVLRISAVQLRKALAELGEVGDPTPRIDLSQLSAEVEWW